MAIYFFFFTLLSFLSISPLRIEKKLSKILKFFFLISLTIFIGLRHEVGGDWDIYLYDFDNNLEYFNFIEFAYVRDFGYEFISFICYNIGIGFYGLNLITAIFFVYVLNKFSKKISKNVWLCFLISFPYIIIVVFMGYTRQGIAMSFILLSILAINEKKLINYACFAFLAVIFHKSAAIIIPIVFLTYFKINFKNLITFLFLVLFSLFIIYPEVTRITAGYLAENNEYVSNGVYYRLFLNILSGFFFIFFYRYLKFNNNFDKLIVLIFLLNILLLFFSFSFSTLVDRIIIYFTFIQLVVFSRLYLIFPKYIIYFNLFVIFFYLLLFLIWLNFSNHSYAWIPYKNILFKYY